MTLKSILKVLDERNYTIDMIVEYLNRLLIVRKTNFNSYNESAQKKAIILTKEIERFLSGNILK